MKNGLRKTDGISGDWVPKAESATSWYLLEKKKKKQLISRETVLKSKSKQDDAFTCMFH